jgi:Cysteine dioxygenase type I
MSLDRDRLQRFIARLAASPEQFSGLIRQAPGARSYAQVWDTPEVNAWLIYWTERGDTGWHDHDDSAAAIAVLSGQLREERLRLDGDPVGRLAAAPATFYVPPSAIHRVTHAGGEPALSLHAYSPPLRRTGAYSIGPDGELERAAQSSEEELRPQAALR